jgi:hypothetical protein
LDLLVRMNVIASADYWLENARDDHHCAGLRVRAMLMRLAGVFEPVPDFQAALEVLEQRGIIWNAYWQEHAVDSGRCKGQYVANLFRAAAGPLGERELLAKYAVPEGLIPTPQPVAFSAQIAESSPERFNLVIGTQTFQPAYQFTDEPRLLETARAIRQLGCSVIKFELSPRYAQRRGNVPAAMAGVRSLVDLARDEPSHRHVLDMPFSHFVLWAHTFSGGEHRWRRGFSPDAAATEYRELYDLTSYLLRTYSGSGKRFYLGHWEGDGWLRGTVAVENDARVTLAAVQGLVDWLATRQRAVDDARRDTPHHRVQVWHYTEVNHVKLAMQGRPALVNRVLPQTDVDLVSYSCYDTQDNPALLKAALSFIEARLKPKPGLTGRRVFIGEYGFPTAYHTPREQERRSRQVMLAGLEWGCPLVLYWQLYNNEVTADGEQRGFWLIDDQGRKQPVYETHARFLGWASQHVRDVFQTTGSVPNSIDFRRRAIADLQTP